MERVGLLINKLQELFQQGANPEQLMLTMQMLQKELVQASNSQGKSLGTKKVAVTMPHRYQPTFFDQPMAAKESVAEVEKPAAAQLPPAAAKEVPVTTSVNLPEPAVEAAIIANGATEAAKVNAETPVFMALEEVPTLHHQHTGKEVNDLNTSETASLNDKLKTTTTELSHTLVDTPVKDLRKAIGINDRFLFINELFRGDEAMYERSIKTINGFNILPEAEYWIQRELKVKLGWLDSQEVVQQFIQVVRRRFS
jgi:hypothetical protein